MNEETKVEAKEDLTKLQSLMWFIAGLVVAIPLSLLIILVF